MACDRCWRLKARCVFDPAQDEDCAQCVKQNAECTWTRAKKPTPAPDKDYVLYLEERTKEIEQRLKQVLPGINIKKEIDRLLETGYDASGDSPSSAFSVATTSQTSISRSRDSQTLSTGHSLNPVGAPVSARLLQAIRLSDVTSTLFTARDECDNDGIWKSNLPSLLPQYYGPSSIEVLTQNAESYLIRRVDERAHFRPDFWRAPEAESRAFANNDHRILADLQANVPPSDLLRILIDGYFERVNLVLPILHRQLLDCQLHDKLHTKDEDFARLLLMICAVGARWCEDPRVLSDRWPSTLSAGYQWFRAALRGGVSGVHRPSLVNAQFMVLSFIFLLGSSWHDMAWLFASAASRMFEALGAHQRRRSHTLADELLKRSFRCYFVLDRFVSTAVGRPSTFQNIDMDMDDLMEIDDVYWSPEPDAPVPTSQHSSLQLITLNHVSKLCVIIGRALQTIFAPGSVKVRVGLISTQGEEWIVRNLNQQLNQWATSAPLNLRLPDSERFTDHPIPHLHMMVTLWIGYCYSAIYINRPFITSKTPEIAAASFHNCRQAARLCAQTIHAYYEIPTALPLQGAIPGIFSSAMILVIDLILNSRPERGERGVDSATSDYIAATNERDLGRCSAALERLEKYMHIAGRLNDVLREFREFWHSRLSAETMATTGPAQPLGGPSMPSPHPNRVATSECLGSSGLYAQQDLNILAFTAPDTLSFGMGIPSLSLSQIDPASNPVGVPDELESQSFPYTAEFLSEEWVLSMEDMMLPGSATYDLASLPPELGHEWNDTMESALRLNEDTSNP